MPTQPNSTTAEPNVAAAALLVASPRDAGLGDDADVRVFSLSASERLERGFARANVAKVANHIGELAGTSGRILVARTDYFYDERLIGALAGADVGTLLRSEDGNDVVAALVNAHDAAVGVALLRGDAQPDRPTCAARDLVSSYDSVLRKHQLPFLLRATRENVRSVENEIFAASYKGITDLVTKWVWPVPARAVVRVCARRGITPNAVTFVSYVLAIAVIALWAKGAFASGLILGWMMTFLDTVDGKLARCTLTSTPLGNVLDHGLDLVHPPIWWAAWALGLVAIAPHTPVADAGAGMFGPFALSVWVIVVGYVVGRLLEGLFMVWFKMDMFTWRPFDALFRQVIARRNPNLLLLSAGVLAGAPAFGLYAIAAWTLGSIAIQIVRIAQASREKAEGRPVRSWYEERAEREAGRAS